jgi:hypothetical protein
MSNEQLQRVVTPEGIKYINLAVMAKQNLKKAVSGNATPAVEAQPVRQVPSARGRISSSASGDEKSVDKWVEDERRRMAKKTTANGSGLRFG